MKNFLLFFVVFILSSTLGKLNACSCAYEIENFCEGLTENEYIFLGVITDKINEYGMTVDVIDNIFQEIPNQSIDILGQDGLNCGEVLTNMNIGDTMLFAVNAENFSTEWWPHLSQDFSWTLSGCSRRYLAYDNGQFNGPITPDISSMSYDEFLSNLIPCIEDTFMPVEAKFAEVGSAWKLRGLSNEAPNPENSESCESSGCGGSYWEYAVNRKEIVEDRICSILEVHHGSEHNQLDKIAEYPIYESGGGQVYFYDHMSESFLLMLDFSLEVGDTLINYAPSLSSNYSLINIGFDIEGQHLAVVTSVDTVEFNGQLLRQQTFGSVDDDNPSINHIVVEGIGNIGAFFGDLTFITEENICKGQFLCFEDDAMEYSIFGDECSCQFQEQITNVQDISEVSGIEVYPNPVHDVLNIMMADYSITQIEIVDMGGRSRILVDNGFTNHTTLETNNLESGVYLLMMETSGGERFYDKIVVD